MQRLSDQRLGTEKISRLIFSMGVPTVLAQIVNLLYNIVDRIYIGHMPEVGTDALTGVGITFPIIIIVTAFSALVSGGGAPIAAIALGSNDKKRAEEILANGVTVLLIFAVILSIVIMLIKNWLLYAVGASSDTIVYAEEYLTVYLFGTLFVYITLGLNPFITAQGRSKVAMCSVLIGAITNIILDPILIYGCDLGVKGAALATVISQFLSAVWVLYILSSKKTSLRIKPKYMKPNLNIIGRISALGVSPFIMQSTEALISFVLISGLAKYGSDLHVGALTVMQSVMQFIHVPVSGFTQGTQPILSYNYGAGKVDRVKKAFRYILIIIMIYTVLSTLSAVLFPSIFASVFTSDAALISLVGRVMPIFICGMLVFGLQMACQNAFMAFGQAKISLFIALLRKVILLVPLAIILPAIFNNVMGVYWAEPIADVTSALVCTLLFFSRFNKILNKPPRLIEQM